VEFLGAGDEIQPVGTGQPVVAHKEVYGVIGDEFGGRQTIARGSHKFIASAGLVQDGQHGMEDAKVIVHGIDCDRSIHEWNRIWDLSPELVGPNRPAAQAESPCLGKVA
jgi:hypothetical protein